MGSQLSGITKQQLTEAPRYKKTPEQHWIDHLAVLIHFFTKSCPNPTQFFDFYLPAVGQLGTLLGSITFFHNTGSTREYDVLSFSAADSNSQ